MSNGEEPTMTATHDAAFAMMPAALPCRMSCRR